MPAEPSLPSADVSTPSSESAIDRLLAAERATLDRVTPAALAAEVAAGALMVDLRPHADRVTDGSLPGAIVVDRLVLEWRLDATSVHRLPQLADPGQRVILVCNDGYASSLAAAALRRLGLRNATDLVGGYRAWRAALPV